MKLKFKFLKIRFTRNFLKHWIVLFTIVTCLSGLIYAIIQQDIRQSANDPQLQLAMDVASQLTSGQTADHFVPSGTTDISSSLATYIIIFDDSKNVLGSSVTLDNKSPIPPSGVFQYAKDHNTNSFTWEPKPGIRQAVVLQRNEGAHPGYVLVGRSLKAIEKREDRMLYLVLAGWLGTLFASFIVSYVFLRKE